MKQLFANEKIKRALLQLGLTSKEVATYLALLGCGTSSVQELSRQTDINRVTVYAALDALKKRGLVAESKKGKRTRFVAEDPEGLKELVAEKKRKVLKEEATLNNLILPTLNSLAKDPQKKPDIRFYEGIEGIYKVYDDIIMNRTKYLIGCGSYDSAIRGTNRKDEIWFFKELKRRKILYKAILEDTPLNREFAELGKGIMHVKYLPKGVTTSADVHAFSSYVCLVSYETMVTTLIEEESMAQSIRLYLEFIWDRL